MHNSSNRVLRKEVSNTTDSRLHRRERAREQWCSDRRAGGWRAAETVAESRHSDSHSWRPSGAGGAKSHADVSFV